MEIKKKDSKNMEKFKSLFFQTGLIIALFVVLAAFEWKKPNSQFDTTFNGPVFVIDPDTTITIELEKKELKPVVNTTQLKITELDVDNNIEVDIDDNQNNKVDIYENIESEVEAPEIGGDEIIKVPPVMPEFPGGNEGLHTFLRNNLKYPQQARDVTLEGIVYVSFVVEKDGSISNSYILRGIGSGCDDEALRVVRKMPQWNPGKNELGRPIRVQMNLPIKFVLKG